MTGKSGRFIILSIIIALFSESVVYGGFWGKNSTENIQQTNSTNSIQESNHQPPSFKVIYSDSKDQKRYTVSALDNSLMLEIDPYGARAEKIAINGNWNRLSNEIYIEDSFHHVKAFDFGFGTFTHLLTNDYRPRYKIIQNTSNSISMSARAGFEKGSVNIDRHIVILSNGQIKESVTVSNTSASAVNLDFEGLAFTFTSLVDFARASSNNNNIPEYRYFDGEKLQKANVHGGSFFGGANTMDFIPNPQWISLADNFFLNVIQPNFSNNVVVYNALNFAPQSRVATGIQVLATNLAPNGSVVLDIDYYIGPRQENIVKKVNGSYVKLFAWPWIFNYILKPIELATIWILNFLVNFTGSVGWTLILIALIVKLCLLPLSIKSAISMKKMRNLQPKLNKLQEKWGHDPQGLQQKTMELYKQEKVNPLGGCLPLLLQIPVFFALFRVLSRSVELRGAGFLWIKDLTLPDSLFMLGSFSFNLLPLIMTLLQLVSVYLQQGRMGSSENEMQKQMQKQSYFMPLIFLFLFWNMPSGLVLYWTIQNVFSIAEQECINLDSRLGKKL